MIRPAEARDLPAVVEILKTVGNYVPEFDYSTMSHPLLVFEHEGRVVGLMQGYLGAPYSYIAEAAVLPEFQNLGVTSALMAAMEETFAACGATGWVAFVRHDNDDCHRKIKTLGAREVNRGSVYQRNF